MMREITATRERPILFSGEMVRAILAGRKSQTRRVIKPQPTEREVMRGFRLDWLDCGAEPERQRYGITSSMVDGAQIACPYGGPGDRLWVRETWARNEHLLSDGFKSCQVAYRSNGQWGSCGGDGAGGYIFCPHGWVQGVGDIDQSGQWVGRSYFGKWRPSIHMPRWASRITLELTQVRAERLHDISDADAEAEGVDAIPSAPAALSHRTAFAGLWDSINGKRPGCAWKDNPWVWVVTFRRDQP